MIDLEQPADHDPSQSGAGFRACASETAPIAALIQRKPRRIDSIDARKMDKTSAFDQLLRGAAAQPEPQRLLFVFATAELPDDATPAQRERYAAGGGGTLAPVICVDKGLAELMSFDALVAESREADAPWHVVFAAGLSGRNGQSPSAERRAGGPCAANDRRTRSRRKAREFSRAGQVRRGFAIRLTQQQPFL